MLEPVTVLLELIFLIVAAPSDLGITSAQLRVASVSWDEPLILWDLVGFRGRWRLVETMVRSQI